MLTELHIENLGVIDRCELVLGPGLTALTGETGAGKTMLVEAIELLTGGRADSGIVRHGAAEARVDGRFVSEDGAEMVLSRVVPAAGRSRAYLNGRLATVASLTAALADSVDLHGQHAHQRLLSVATQRSALDAFGKVDLSALRNARARLTEIDAALAALGGDERARAREIDLLRYQVAELDDAAIEDPGEDARLDAEESVLADAAAHREAGATARSILSDDGGVRERISDALGALEGRQPFSVAATRLHDVLAELDDLGADIRSASEAIDESPTRLEHLRERRQILKDMRRKYGNDLAAVMAFHSEASDRLHELEQFDQRAAELDGQRERALADERSAAAVVGAARRRAAPMLAQVVGEGLHGLAMPDATISVQVGEHDADDPGDRVQFLLAANPGSPVLPLTRVASGGELARTMLALRLALTTDADEHSAHQTMIFDEVDAGIGGAAAQAVAAALAALGEHHQVLVVTHLAQVAAQAAEQIVVTKAVVDDETFTSVQHLRGKERVDEIARMLSGSTSASAKRHARELLA